MNRNTSSILAVFPSLTQVWKKLGATDTPRASEVIPVWARSELIAITRNVPKSRTKSLWVYGGSDVINLKNIKTLQWDYDFGLAGGDLEFCHNLETVSTSTIRNSGDYRVRYMKITELQMFIKLNRDFPLAPWWQE